MRNWTQESPQPVSSLLKRVAARRKPSGLSANPVQNRAACAAPLLRFDLFNGLLTGFFKRRRRNWPEASARCRAIQLRQDGFAG